jgi:dTDP-4-amino-4,6-dideoxygalactose transaminase
MIKFNQPYLTGEEIKNIRKAMNGSRLSGDGDFTELCNSWLTKKIGTQKALITPSCTASLEMSALLSGLKPGDEVIMPSFTFVSTANAFVLRGAVPVFVDIRSDTLNINEQLIERAITPKTRAIVAVHYAGVSCEMVKLKRIAKKYALILIEDAAQAMMSEFHGKPLGSFGDFSCWSFHDTKNIIAGEGGALLINDKSYVDRAEIIREKGTNRSKFFRGEVDKYSWVDIGSSYLASEITCAFLYAQLQFATNITQMRLDIWQNYFTEFQDLSDDKKIKLPHIPKGCKHNGHIFYLIMRDPEEKHNYIEFMKKLGVQCTSHYIPLHTSLYGLKYARADGDLVNTVELSERLVRLPIWPGLKPKDQGDIIGKTRLFFNEKL